MNSAGACVQIAACICAKDGVISEVEELKIFEIVSETFQDFSHAAFDSALTDLFESDSQLEDYLSLVDDPELRVFALRLSRVSAESDGLDFRENIAFMRACRIWEIEPDV